MMKESKTQKVARIIISNLIGLFVFFTISKFSPDQSSIKYFLTILILFFIFVDIRILKNKL